MLESFVNCWIRKLKQKDSFLLNYICIQIVSLTGCWNSIELSYDLLFNLGKICLEIYFCKVFGFPKFLLVVSCIEGEFLLKSAEFSYIMRWIRKNLQLNSARFNWLSLAEFSKITWIHIRVSKKPAESSCILEIFAKNQVVIKTDHSTLETLLKCHNKIFLLTLVIYQN